MHELVAGYANYASTEALLWEQAAGIEAGYHSVVYSWGPTNSITLTVTF
ncbi:MULTISPECIES: hypothetical protein [Herbidospora]|nr:MULTISPECIES: hypothetical protein [Herbidospora]GLX98307.1 hypothetical protein Hesp01_62570 [Herbidospora sp. NBRC 101105]